MEIRVVYLIIIEWVFYSYFFDYGVYNIKVYIILRLFDYGILDNGWLIEFLYLLEFYSVGFGLKLEFVLGLGENFIFCRKNCFSCFIFFLLNFNRLNLNFNLLSRLIRL